MHVWWMMHRQSVKSLHKAIKHLINIQTWYFANAIKLSKKSFNDGYIGYTRNCVAFFLMLKMFFIIRKSSIFCGIYAKST